MRGLYFGRGENSYIEKIEKNSAVLKLIAHGDGTEVMIQDIGADKVFGIGPADKSETMEFFYILDGSVLYDDQKKTITLNKGEFFYVHRLNERAIFKTLEPTKLLYLSTQPVFHYLSNMMKEIFDIARKVEEKDVYTHNHGRRVQDYSAEIGKRLGLSGDRYRELCYAALLHDIGKVHVPDSILKKKGRLTDEEYDIIKKHPVDGSKMVQGTYLQSIGDIIDQHHERLNGSGYPSGLKGDEILLEAKIIGVVDSYDAMTSDRPYRKGMDKSVALQELKDLTGKLYEQQVVDTFEQILKAEIELKQE